MPECSPTPFAEPAVSRRALPPGLPRQTVRAGHQPGVIAVLPRVLLKGADHNPLDVHAAALRAFGRHFCARVVFDDDVRARTTRCQCRPWTIDLPSEGRAKGELD